MSVRASSRFQIRIRAADHIMANIPPSASQQTCRAKYCKSSSTSSCTLPALSGKDDRTDPLKHTRLETASRNTRAFKTNEPQAAQPTRKLKHQLPGCRSPEAIPPFPDPREDLKSRSLKGGSHKVPLVVSSGIYFVDPPAGGLGSEFGRPPRPSSRQPVKPYYISFL